MRVLLVSLALLVSSISHASLLGLFHALSGGGSAPPVLSGLTKAGSNGWNAGAWSSGLAATGDVKIEITTAGINELAFGLKSGVTVGVTDWSNPDYGFLRYGSGEIYVQASGAILFHGGANPGASVVMSVERSGTSIIFKSNGTTYHTATGVSAATPFYPLFCANFNGDQIFSATWNGIPLAWTSFSGGVSAF